MNRVRRGLTRRRWLAGGCPPCPYCPPIAPGGAPATGASLALAAAVGGLSFGAAATWAGLSSDPVLREVFARECDWVTPELDMKWAAVEPSEGALTLKPMDGPGRLGSGQHKSVRGHTLLWHNSVPPWAAERMAEAQTGARSATISHR